MNHGTIIAGSRHITNIKLVFRILDTTVKQMPNKPTHILSGGARGVDRIAENWGLQRGYQMHYYPAQWDVHGRAAGPIRNRKMAENAQQLIVIWDGSSRGAANMIATARKLRLPIYEHIVR